MGVIDWFKSWGKKVIPLSGEEAKAFADEYAELVGDVWIREMAFMAAVNLIAGLVDKCEIRTYFKGEEVKGREYYLWNYEPNKNQSADVFKQTLIARLYRHNEALVVNVNDQLLIADSWQVKPYALYDDVFTNVQVGDISFGRSFSQSEVLYFKLSDRNVKQVVDNVYAAYSKLIAYGMKGYQRSRGTKGVFSYESIPPAGSEERKAFDALVSQKFRAWLEADSGVIPIGRGQTYTNESAGKTYSSENTRDIRAMIDDVFDFYAREFQIPPALMQGKVAGIKDTMDLMLTICIDPLVHKLATEINRKRNGYEGIKNGTYHVIDTTMIKHVDVLDVSSSVEKLIGSGFSPNEVRLMCGEQPIDEPWANEHYMTKNFATSESLLTAEGGGSD